MSDTNNGSARGIRHENKTHPLVVRRKRICETQWLLVLRTHACVLDLHYRTTISKLTGHPFPLLSLKHILPHDLEHNRVANVARRVEAKKQALRAHPSSCLSNHSVAWSETRHQKRRIEAKSGGRRRPTTDIRQQVSSGQRGNR